MEKWIPYAIVAAIFIAVRDFISKDILNMYTYSDYVIVSNIIIFIGTIVYLLYSKKDITKIRPPKFKELMTISVRLLLIYIIIDPCIFNSLKLCNNPGYAKSIINLNTIILIALAFIFYKSEINMKKIIGIMVVLFGTYLVL